MNAVTAKASSDRRGTPWHRAKSREGVLKTIAAFKLVKALLLVGVGLGSLNLLNPTAADKAERWVSILSWRLGPRAAFAVQNRLSRFGDSQLRMVAIVAFLYAGLFAVEGVGLWKSKRWAEYLTIIATSSLVPFEVYELIRHASWQRVVTLGINLLVVGYLIWKVRQNAA
jgi:uncharacterized membrane protein (DUF2068 family)